MKRRLFIQLRKARQVLLDDSALAAAPANFHFAQDQLFERTQAQRVADRRQEMTKIDRLTLLPGPLEAADKAFEPVPLARR